MPDYGTFLGRTREHIVEGEGRFALCGVWRAGTPIGPLRLDSIILCANCKRRLPETGGS